MHVSCEFGKSGFNDPFQKLRMIVHLDRLAVDVTGRISEDRPTGRRVSSWRGFAENPQNPAYKRPKQLPVKIFQRAGSVVAVAQEGGVWVFIYPLTLVVIKPKTYGSNFLGNSSMISNTLKNVHLCQ